MGASMRQARFTGIEEVKREHDPEVVDLVVRSAYETDVPADALVAAFRRLPGGEGWRVLDRALHSSDAAARAALPELAPVLGPCLEPPAWVDFDVVDRGAIAWWRAGSFNQLLALSAGSLAYGYQVPSLARPLAATGRLMRMAPRRLMETSRWVLAATRPGALHPGEAGFDATVRLRMVHALVRAHLRARGDWDTARLGVPLSVGDTLATGMFGFFLFPLEALEDIGVRYSDRELEAICHLWKWVCHLMGVPDEYLPADLDAAVRAYDAAFALEAEPSEDGAALMQALLWHSADLWPALPGPAQAAMRGTRAHMLGGFARRWMGDEMADHLEVPDTPVKYLAPALRPLNRARSLALSALSLGSSARIAAFELAFTERMMEWQKAAPAQIAPEEVEREPELRAA
jgi:hypothetical protein